MSETTTPTIDTSAAPAAPAAPAAQTDPRAWLPEEYRADKGFEKFTDVGALAKSYREAAKFVGLDKAEVLRIPRDEAAPEWGDVWTKLGRPEKPDGYTFEGLDGFPDDALAGFRQAAHAANLPAKQAQAVAQWYAQFQGQQRDAMRTQAETELQKEWGAAFRDRLHGARQLMEEAGGPEVREFIERSGFGNHPAVIRMFAKIAAERAEPGALKGGATGQQPGAGSLTPGEAKAEWDKLQRDADFMAKYIKGNGPEVERSRRLFAMMHPGVMAISA